MLILTLIILIQQNNSLKIWWCGGAEYVIHPNYLVAINQR